MRKKTPRRIIAQPYDFSVQDLVDKIEAGDIDFMTIKLYRFEKLKINKLRQ